MPNTSIEEIVEEFKEEWFSPVDGDVLHDLKASHIDKLVNDILTNERKQRDEAVKKERDNWRNLLDDDSCECDNCHRTRRYLANTQKELLRIKNKLQAITLEGNQK